ncbi:MAG TPA: universal stress protein, partial [Methanotrichaceae archaeon]|nr:universal stress protein [Methanotrichaceae archaeon]
HIMFEKALIPTDFSKYAYKTIDCATNTPGVDELVILHVVDDTRPSISGKPGKASQDKIDDAETRLNEQKRYLESEGWKIKTRLEVIKEGNVAGAIQRIADEENASLIMMPSRGKGLVSGIVMGSVSADALRYGSTDLLILRSKLMDDKGAIEKLCSKIFSRVLFATDFSGPALAAMRAIKDFPGIEEVNLAHVVSGGESTEEIDAASQDAARMLNDLGDYFRSAGIRVRIHVPVGHPPDEICSLADRENLSLIVISSHGKGWIRQTLGSTAYDVARAADQPVLVIRAEKHS